MITLSPEAKWFQSRMEAEPELKAAVAVVADALARSAPFYECRLSEANFDDAVRDVVAEDLELTLVNFADGIDEVADAIARDNGGI